MGEVVLKYYETAYKPGALVMSIGENGAWDCDCLYVQNKDSRDLQHVSSAATSLTIVSDEEIRVGGNYTYNEVNMDWTATLRKNGESSLSIQQTGTGGYSMTGQCRKVDDNSQVYKMYFSPNGGGGLQNMMSCEVGKVYQL